jgi:hypothetical protein
LGNNGRNFGQNLNHQTSYLLLYKSEVAKLGSQTGNFLSGKRGGGGGVRVIALKGSIRLMNLPNGSIGIHKKRKHLLPLKEKKNLLPSTLKMETNITDLPIEILSKIFQLLSCSKNVAPVSKCFYQGTKNSMEPSTNFNDNQK